MRQLLLHFLAYTLVIYQSDNKTDQIKIYDLSEDIGIEIVCAEGVSREECLGGSKEVESVESISYEDIQNFVMRGPYLF